MVDKIKLARGTVKFVVSTSVGTTIAKAVKSNVTPSNSLEQAQLVVGAYAIGAMVSDRAVDWADAKFESTLEAIRKFKSPKTEESTTE